MGAQLLDLLLLDAYAFRRNGVTGGACIEWAPSTSPKEEDAVLQQERMQQKKDMIVFFGL